MAEVAKGIIDIEINTGNAAAQLKSLQAQINAFNLALSKQNKNQSIFAADYAKELQLAVTKTGMFTAETVKLATAASTLDKALSKGKSSLGQFFSAKFNKDSAAAAEVMGLAAERASRMQTQFIATSAAAKGMQEALAIRPMAAFSSEMSIAAQKSEIMSAMFKQGTTQLINFGKNVQWAGRQLMVGFTVPLTIFGNTAGKTFMELEKQIVSFKKVYGDMTTTPKELNQNIDAVKSLAEEYTKYGIAAKDTIGLAAQAAAAGRKNADLTDAVAQATRLATLGQMDQNSALETTISLQSAFRLSGKELADSINFLNMVENQTVVSLQDLSAAIPRVAPVIVGLGGDVKDLAVFLAAMQEGGVDAAEGANALKSGLASLINPTKQATQMLAGMGINLDAIIQANKGDLMGTVMAFSQALSALDQFSRQQALEQVFGKFQYAKLGALFDNISRQGSQAQQVIATMGYTTEQLGATADKELKTIEQAFGVQLTAAVEKLKLAIAPIGEIFVKTAIPIVNFLTDILNKFNALSEGKKQFIAIAAALTGIVIPAGTMLFGLLLNLTGTLLKMSQALKNFGKGLITGGPVGALKALSQGSKYLSLAEIDAAMAAQQLAGASQAVNVALVEQAGAAGTAQAAINSLAATYERLIAAQVAASQYASFKTSGAAASVAKNIKTGGAGFKGIRRNKGGMVPGVGNTDSIPALLTPGESVITKQATQKYGPVIDAMNSGKLPGFIRGVRDVQFNGVGQAISKFGGLSGLAINAATAATSGGKASISRKGFLNASQMKSLIPGFKGNSSLYKAKGTSGLYITDIVDPKILNKYPQFVKNGKITKESINGTLTAGNLPSELMIAAYKANSTGNTNSSQQFIGALLKNGIIGKDDAAKVLQEIEKRYFDTITKMGSVSDSNNPFWKISDDVIKKQFVGNKKASDFWNSFSNSVGVHTNEHRRSTSSKNIILRNADGDILRVGKLSGTEGSLFAHTTTPEPLQSRIKAISGYSNGGSVPGSGSKDTVPAMLTPGEFVVNKDATKQNYDLLNKINGGSQMQKFGIGGKVLSGAAQVGGAAAMMSGNPLLMGLGFAAQMLPGMLSGRGGDGGNLGGFSGGIKDAVKSFKGISVAGRTLTLGMTSMAAGVALAGFGVYKLNQKLKEQEKAGANLVKAMNGSADRIDAMGEAFGRESYADAARRLAVEKAGGQQVSQEAQQASGQFMSSDAGKQLLADMQLVRSQGKDTVEALRNQLASSIVAGVLTTEEARAIAIDISKELGDQKLSVGVSGQLTKLFGPDGKDVIKNISSITAQISPKIDRGALAEEAQNAFDDKNLIQKVGQFFIRGGQEGFKQNYAVEKIAEANKTAFEIEAQALSALNAAYLEGAISSTEYVAKQKEVEQQSKKQLDINAKALGYKNQQDLVESASKTTQVTMPTSGETVTTAADPLAQKIIKEQKQAVQAILETQTGSKTAAEKIIKDFEEVGDSAWGKLLSGEWSFEDKNLILSLQRKGMSEEEVSDTLSKLKAIRAIPDIDKRINFETDPGAVDQVYGKLTKLEESAKKGPLTRDVLVDVVGAGSIDENIMGLLGKLPTSVSIPIIMEVLVNARATTTGNGGREQTGEERDTTIRNALDRALQAAIASPGSGDGNADGNGGGGTGTNWKEYLKNRFDLVDKRLSLEAQKYQDIIDLQERQNQMDQRSIDLNNKAISQISKQEEALNKKYDERISLLDGVAESNNRLKEQESSRIDLARALAEGNVSTAAQIMGQMTANEANYRIEDTRAALEKQKEEDLKNIRVEVNGQLLTREQIQANIDAIEEQIYQRNILVQDQQDKIYAIEQERLANTREREKVETRLFLLEQRKAIVALQGKKASKGLTTEEKTDLATYKNSYNQMASYFNSMFGESVPQIKMYGGKIKRFAMGSVVPGMGNTDRVPALLTPGEFVIRKSAAQANMPLLEMINNGIFPKLGGPSYNIPNGSAGVASTSVTNSSVMYNDTYNINVNVGGSNASPDDIANVVMSKLSQTNRGSIRGIRY